MASNEETNAAGTDTRSQMLVENELHNHGRFCIHRVLNSTANPMASCYGNPSRMDLNLNPWSTDPPLLILLQGLPRHIFNILNQTSTAKEIWDNVEMLMQGSGRTLQQRKEDLFDEYERFRAIGNESIHDYFVRFHKLVNDMKITQLEIPTHQMEMYH
ncbi:hypothetical protein Tco_1377888 [Tanacetum coccineum]